MKQPEKEFILSKKRPQVLLLGNGLCRSFGGISWNGLLDRLKEASLYPADAKNYLMPMPLKAAMLTNNQLAKKMRNVVRPHSRQKPAVDGYDWSSFVRITPEMKRHLRGLIGDRFDYVLTTNYSYEIEAALLDRESLSQAQVAGLMDFHEVEHAQTQFMTNTYNDVNGVPVWHVHGEARKPGSMIVGSYYYGKLLRRCVERLDAGGTEPEDGSRKRGAPRTVRYQSSFKHEKPIRIGSWIDAFVLGDVYILGFGLDFSESDIWWLIEYKANFPELCGSTRFYDPAKDSAGSCIHDEELPCAERWRFIDRNQCRNELLKNTYGVETYDLGVTARGGDDYVRFYEEAIRDITRRVDGLPR